MPDANTATLSHATAGEPLVLHFPRRKPEVDDRPAPAPLFIRDRNGLQRMDRAAIRSLVADGNYVEVHTAERRYVLRNSLREVVAQLDDPRFVQINRNTVINVERLQRVDADCVEVDDTSLTLSRNFRSALLDRLNILSGR